MIEIKCIDCKNCTVDSCKVYGSDADKAVKSCADDSFRNYKARMTREEAAGVIARLPVMSYMKKNEKQTIITEALDMAIAALREPEQPWKDLNKEDVDKIVNSFKELEDSERKWIPVSERLPEKPNYYEVTVDFGSKQITETVFYSICESRWGAYESYVTAWRERLQEPYNAGEE